MNTIWEKVKVILNKKYDLPPLKVWHFIVAALAIVVVTAVVLL